MNLTKTDAAIIAVDFDGTLCTDCYPAIGEPNHDLIEQLIRIRHAGSTKLILWTCRTGSALSAAVDWCSEKGLQFDAVNQNLQENIDKYGSDCRKVFADIYIDDRSFAPY